MSGMTSLVIKLQASEIFYTTVIQYPL